MKKMSEAEVRFVVMLLRTWHHGPLRWESVRSRISSEFFDGGPAWTRQSLQANARISAAWDAAKLRLSGRATDSTLEGDGGSAKIKELQVELDDLRERYDALFIRHRTLAYNASFLPGGTNLLLDPLPDNTPVESKSRRRKGSKR